MLNHPRDNNVLFVVGYMFCDTSQLEGFFGVPLMFHPTFVKDYAFKTLGPIHPPLVLSRFLLFPWNLPVALSCSLPEAVHSVCE
jgi:hypothetical protein